MKYDKIILSSDLHGRTDNPVCRKDSYVDAFVKKLVFIEKLRKKLKAIHVCAGDIVDKYIYKSATQIVQTTGCLIENLPGKTYGVAGNHDLLNRTMSKFDSSIIRNVASSGKYNMISTITEVGDNIVLWGFNYGSKMEHREVNPDKVNIAVIHTLVVDTESSIFGGVYGMDLLKEFTEFDVILTGDNHKTFTMELDGRKLINPGSLMRMDADQKDHKPSVFVLDTDDLSIEQIFVPIEEGVVSTEHIEKKKEDKANFDEVIECLESDYALTFDFEEDMETHIKENKLKGLVATKIREAINPDKRIRQ